MTASLPPASTIMVVDDTPANLLLLEEILTGGGYRVSAFPSGELALEAMRHAAPDLLLLDIMMPGLDGYAVCKRLKADPALQAIPVIFISALSQVREKVRALASGGVDYVTKPFFAEEVIARISVHLDLQARRQEVECQRNDLEQAHAQLKELEGQRDAMVHMVAHDMKSPLTTITMASSLLQQLVPRLSQANGDLALAQAAERSVESVGTSAQRLRDLVITFLDVSRLEHAGMPLTLARHDVRELTSRVIELMGPRLSPERFDYPVPDRPAMAICDGELVERILQNLIDNALNHGGPHVRVTLGLEPGAEGVRVEVRDSGRGIPASLRDQIFEKFGQAGSAAGGKRPGSGLGLTFCKLAVEAQGGEIDFSSQEGQGSVFWFTLPDSPTA